MSQYRSGWILCVSNTCQGYLNNKVGFANGKTNLLIATGTVEVVGSLKDNTLQPGCNICLTVLLEYFSVKFLV